MKKTFTILTFLLFVIGLLGQELIAHYPFAVDGHDASGFNSNAQLTNTQFSNGGIFSNGIYIGNDPNGSHILTPNINSFTNNEFEVEIEVNPQTSNNLLMVGGSSWRWMQVRTDNIGQLFVQFSMTNGFDVVVNTSKVLPNNSYSTIRVTYRESILQTDVYVDDHLEASQNLDAQIQFNNDYNFTNDNGGSGITFLGHWKNLKIYNSTTTGIDNYLENTSIQIHPNPAQNFITIEGERLMQSIYTLSNLVGAEIEKGHLVTNGQKLNTSSLDSGIYFLKIEGNGTSTIKKVIISH